MVVALQMLGQQPEALFGQRQWIQQWTLDLQWIRAEEEFFVLNIPAMTTKSATPTLNNATATKIATTTPMKMLDTVVIKYV